MAGLTVLLEAQAKGLTTHNNPQILCKAEALRFSQSLPSRTAHRPPHTPTPATFLELCFLCRRHLSHEKDIYMYRGDRAFCSEECRRRQILMDEDDVGREKKGRSRHRKGTNNKSRVTARGGFAY